MFQYIIQPRDRINCIAKRFCVTVDAIITENPGLSQCNLCPGRVIIIPDALLNDDPPESGDTVFPFFPMSFGFPFRFFPFRRGYFERYPERRDFYDRFPGTYLDEYFERYPDRRDYFARYPYEFVERFPEDYFERFPERREYFGFSERR